MRDYVKEYPDATLDEFRVAYSKLDSKKRQVRTLRSPFRTWIDTSAILGF